MANTTEDTIQFSAPVQERTEDKGPEVIVLKFADSEIPVFKEERSKDYIKFGADNLYPNYLEWLYNKSAKHNAIINGKAMYIFGNGSLNADTPVNRYGETLNDIVKKSAIDVELYGGYRWEVIWGYNKKIVEIYHTDFATLRKRKGGGFIFKETWDTKIDPRAEAKNVASFDPNNPVGSQIFEYNEYRPGGRYYPLPSYIGANNYIETDIEISVYYLSSIRNGMMPSKMIQFYSGSVTEEKKRAIEKRWTQKFAGAGNAGRFVLVFNEANAAKGVEINDLSATELDKHFIEMNKVTQQEIYAGHNVTSPMLFGIKTEGQLGGTTELQISYAIFQNTYSKPKAKAIDKEVNYVMKYSMFPVAYELQPNDPIGAADGAVVAPAAQGAAVNDTIKNLTGRQSQAIQRIQRQYENPNNKMTWKQAAAMLKAGYGLSDEDVIAFIGEEPAQFAANFSQDETIAIFDEYGDTKDDYEIVKTKRISFSSTEAAGEDETIWAQEAFKTYDVTATEDKILELIKKDPKITNEVIATTINQTKAFVESKVASLVKRGYLEVGEEAVGADVVMVRSVPKDIDIKVPPRKGPATQIKVLYSYEGPQDSRNRPFCAKLMALNRLYNRFEIEKISERLGYSVFDRRGGFWTHPDGVTTPYCRHHWKSNVVIKKGGPTP